MRRTTTRTCKPLQPVAGVARWLKPLGLDNDGRFDGTEGGLEINGTLYFVLIHRDAGKVAGYALVKAATGDHYDIDTTASHGWQCDCPDAIYRGERPGGCKHVCALKAALAKLLVA